MFYENELRLLQKTLNKCHIPTQMVDPHQPTRSWLDTQMAAWFAEDELSRSLYEWFPSFTTATIYRLTDLFLCRYLFMELPYTDDPTVLIIGPYLNVNVTQQTALEQAERIGLPPQRAVEMERFYSTLPLIREENFLYAAISTFAEFLWNGEENYYFTDLNFEISPLLTIMTDRRTTDTEALDIAIMERRYEYENELMNAVSQGNVQKVEMMIPGFSGVSFENRVPDRLRNLKNYCIITNTLLRKAAERGGVHPVHLDQISSDHARRIETLRTTEEAIAYVGAMMRAYCRLVKRHSMKNMSPLVQKAMVFIENDLTGDLSLNTVARLNNVSPGYLSGLFKKESGQTFTAYVNGRRIHRAKHLLRTTNLQIQTIAQHCGILDFHYFCRVFKNATGVTPTTYRSKHIYD